MIEDSIILLIHAVLHIEKKKNLSQCLRSIRRNPLYSEKKAEEFRRMLKRENAVIFGKKRTRYKFSNPRNLVKFISSEGEKIIKIIDCK